MQGAADDVSQAAEPTLREADVLAVLCANVANRRAAKPPVPAPEARSLTTHVLLRSACYHSLRLRNVTASMSAAWG